MWHESYQIVKTWACFLLVQKNNTLCLLLHASSNTEGKREKHHRVHRVKCLSTSGQILCNLLEILLNQFMEYSPWPSITMTKLYKIFVLQLPEASTQQIYFITIKHFASKFVSRDNKIFLWSCPTTSYKISKQARRQNDYNKTNSELMQYGTRIPCHLQKWLYMFQTLWTNKVRAKGVVGLRNHAMLYEVDRCCMMNSSHEFWWNQPIPHAYTNY